MDFYLNYPHVTHKILYANLDSYRLRTLDKSKAWKKYWGVASVSNIFFANTYVYAR